jgi:hypothetical protein
VRPVGLNRYLRDGCSFFHQQVRPVSLIAVGTAANIRLGESRLVAQQIGSVRESSAPFPAYPRISHPSAATASSHAEARPWDSTRSAEKAPGMQLAKRFLLLPSFELFGAGMSCSVPE